MKNQIMTILKELVTICEEEKISYWVIGGFSVDGKKGQISRVHKDIDICILQSDLTKCLKCFFKRGYKIGKEGLKYDMSKSDIIIDIYDLIENNDYYERKREYFTLKIPSILFNNSQILNIDDLKFRSPSNEALRFFVSKSSHPDDKEFINNLPYDHEIFSKIEYNEFADHDKIIKNIERKELTFNDD